MKNKDTMMVDMKGGIRRRIDEDARDVCMYVVNCMLVSGITTAFYHSIMTGTVNVCKG